MIKKNEFHYHVLIVQSAVFHCDTFRYTYTISLHSLLLLTFHVPLTSTIALVFPLSEFFMHTSTLNYQELWLKGKD